MALIARMGGNVETTALDELVKFWLQQGVVGACVVMLITACVWAVRRFDASEARCAQRMDKREEDYAKERDKILTEHRQERAQWSERQQTQTQSVTATLHAIEKAILESRHKQ